GGVLYRPASREYRPLGDPPPATFVEALRARKVSPLAIGRCIVATWQPNESVVLEVIRDLGLELQVIFNKGAVMVLPTGLKQASGVGVALLELGLARHNCVGVGDAENDHALMRLSECGVAVANALPLVQERADWVTPSRNGDGVAQLIERLIADDLATLSDRLGRHAIVLGTRVDGEEVWLDPYGLSLLVAGGPRCGGGVRRAAGAWGVGAAGRALLLLGRQCGL